MDTWRFGERDMHAEGVEALSPFPVKESNLSSQNIYLWQKNYFEVKARTLQTQEKFYLFLACVIFSVCLTLCNPRGLPGSSIHEIFLQEYLSGLPFPIPGDRPNPGIEPASLAFRALAGSFFTNCATLFNCLK